VRRTLVVAGLVLAAVAAPSASGAGPFAPCAPNGLECATLTVPLDYSGATPGTLSLHVEELPAAGMPRGVMLLLAGGRWAAGEPDQALTSETLSHLYGLPVEVLRIGGRVVVLGAELGGHAPLPEHPAGV